LRAPGDVGERGHAELDGVCRAPERGGDLGELVIGAREADLESLHFTEPAFAFGLGDAVEQVGADLLEAVPLGGVRPQERAPDAPLTELTVMFQQFTARFRSLALTCPRDRIG
jgi:hypothetical protein